MRGMRLRKSTHRACFDRTPDKWLRLRPRSKTPSRDVVTRVPKASSELLRTAGSCANLLSPCLRHWASREHAGRRIRRNCEQGAAQIVKPSKPWKLFVLGSDVPAFRPPGCSPPVTRPTRQTEMNMTTKIVLALALAMTALASVPASASPHHDWQVAGNCQEDLGYGRTSGWGCG